MRAPFRSWLAFLARTDRTFIHTALISYHSFSSSASHSPTPTCNSLLLIVALSLCAISPTLFVSIVLIEIIMCGFLSPSSIISPIQCLWFWGFILTTLGWVCLFSYFLLSCTACLPMPIVAGLSLTCFHSAGVS